MVRFSVNHSQKKWHRVSAVVVNWNRLADVSFNIQFLRKSGYPNLEIIVVDNGSEPECVEELKRLEGIKLICLSKNEGPSHARNVGFEKATGKYVLLIDSDAVLGKNCLKDVVTQMEEDPSIGVAGFEILNWHTRRLDQWIYAQSHDTHAGQVFDTYSFSAAGALIRADVLKKVGGFWEKLFIYNEEVELSIRILRAGYRIIYTPFARVYHRPSKHGRAKKDKFFRNQIRNWIWIFFRHYSKPTAWWKTGIYSGVYLVKGLCNRNFTASLRGILDGIKGRGVSEEFSDKLTPEEARLIACLNRRTSIRLKDITTTDSHRRHRVLRPVRSITKPVKQPVDVLEDDDLLAAT